MPILRRAPLASSFVAKYCTSAIKKVLKAAANRGI
jgi:hypothetical protein